MVTHVVLSAPNPRHSRNRLFLVCLATTKVQAHSVKEFPPNFDLLLRRCVTTAPTSTLRTTPIRSQLPVRPRRRRLSLWELHGSRLFNLTLTTCALQSFHPSVILPSICQSLASCWYGVAYAVPSIRGDLLSTSHVHLHRPRLSVCLSGFSSDHLHHLHHHHTSAYGGN